MNNEWEFDMNDILLTDQPNTYPELTLTDRCDACPNQCSQAFVRAIKVVDGKEQELLFCGHHYNKHNPALWIDGWLIQDERNKVNQKPMSGSNYTDGE